MTDQSYHAPTTAAGRQLVEQLARQLKGPVSFELRKLVGQAEHQARRAAIDEMGRRLDRLLHELER